MPPGDSDVRFSELDEAARGRHTRAAGERCAGPAAGARSRDGTEELTLGTQYKYKFRTPEIKTPIQEAVVACGWVYKGVVFGSV